MKYLIICLLAMLLSLSCTQRFKNEKIAALRLKDFILTSLEIKNPAEKDKLLTYLHGQMEEDISKMSSDEFNKKFIEQQIKLSKVVMLESETIDENNVQILYDIYYRKLTDDGEVDVTAKKVAVLTYIENHWKISTIYDLETTFLFPDALAKKQPGNIF